MNCVPVYSGADPATPCPDCVRGYRAALPGRQSRPDTARRGPRQCARVLRGPVLGCHCGDAAAARGAGTGPAQHPRRRQNDARALDTVHGRPSAGALTQDPSESSHRTRSIAAMTAGSSGSSPSACMLGVRRHPHRVGRDAHCQGFQMRVATPSAVCAAVIAVLWAPGGPRCTPAHAPAIV